VLNGIGQPSPLVSTIISAMITPAILILATGNLIGTSMMLHSRVVDRARVLLARRAALHESDPAKAAFADTLLAMLRARMHLTTLSLCAYYLAVGCFVACSLTIALTLALELPRWISAGLTVAGAALLFLGAIATFGEMLLSNRAMHSEIDAGFF